MTAPPTTTWRPRPVVAVLVRVVLLTLPLAASAAAAYLVGRQLPAGAVDRWWGLTTVLVACVLTGVLFERATRRLLPVALLLKLTLVFPDRAPSRLKVARQAALRPPRGELVWSGSTARPTTTGELVVHLVAALGRHDRRTRGHSERVRVLCDMLAAELRLDKEDRERLQWAALLHDVGKMAVPARVLNKPAALDVREFVTVQQHPRAGAELAAPLLPWLGKWGEGILDHHEKYDGSGYPNGKAGEDISAAGRIIAVVDAFETMTAARPYKKAMATRTARAELARCAGTHFDPGYVRAFLAISLPRLLWAMGALSFVLQLPFLRPIAQAGQRAAAAGPQTSAAVAGAAGAAVLVTGGAAVVGDATGTLDLQPGTPAVAAPHRVAVPAAAQTTRGREPRREPLAPAAPRAAAAPVVLVAPAAAPPSAAPAPAPTRTTGEPARRPSTRTSAGSTGAKGTRPPAQRSPAPTTTGLVPGDGPVVLLGPASPTTATTATFRLAVPPGARWECQLLRNTSGGSSRWEPCGSTITVSVLRDGDNTLRVRDAETSELVDTWTWTVVD